MAKEGFSPAQSMQVGKAPPGLLICPAAVTARAELHPLISSSCAGHLACRQLGPSNMTPGGTGKFPLNFDLPTKGRGGLVVVAAFFSLLQLSLAEREIQGLQKTRD